MNEDALNARRIAIVESIDAAWEKHAQHIMMQMPTGCDSLRQVQCGKAMGRLGFNLAAMAIIEQIIGEEMV